MSGTLWVTESLGFAEPCLNELAEVQQTESLAIPTKPVNSSLAFEKMLRQKCACVWPDLILLSTLCNFAVCNCDVAPKSNKDSFF